MFKPSYFLISQALCYKIDSSDEENDFDEMTKSQVNFIYDEQISEIDSIFYALSRSSQCYCFFLFKVL